MKRFEVRLALFALAVAVLQLLSVVGAKAQTVTMKVNSIWSFTEDQKNSLAVTLLRKNALSGNLEAIPGQRLALEQMKIVYGKPLKVPESLSATFPGQKTAPMTVVAVRLFHRGSGTGWSMRRDNEIDADPFPDGPLIVPAGQKVSCTYLMPVGQMGKLTCAVGATPPVANPPPPPPPPPPPTTTSKPGDQSPPLAQLIAADGANWVLVLGRVYRNAIETNNPYSPNISFIYISPTNTIRSQATSGVYMCWTGTAWAGSGC
jgi:hypothetical protein